MPTYQFATGDLTAEHRRTPVREVLLTVTAMPRGSPPAPGLVLGKYQIQGSLLVDCAAGENRQRPGMQAVLRVVAPDGRRARMPVLLIANPGIAVAEPGYRRYTWEFLVPSTPGIDTVGLVPRLTPSSEPREITVAELLEILGPLSVTPDAAGSVRFTAEGGFLKG